MSLDMETGVYIEPKGDPNTDDGMCALSVVLIVVGGICFLAGFICALEMRHDGWIFLAIGTMSCVFDLALAVIVDACQKYRKAHKG